MKCNVLECRFQFLDSSLMYKNPYTGLYYCICHYPQSVRNTNQSDLQWNKEDFSKFNDAILMYIGNCTKNNNKINLAGLLFPSSIDFSSLKKITASITFKDSIFQGETNFRDVNFISHASFEESRFEKGANFIDTKFSDTGYFPRANFDFPGTNTHFNSATFTQDTFFYGAAFHAVSFSNAKFNTGRNNGTGVDFTGATFSLNVDFRNTIFNYHAIFLPYSGEHNASSPSNVEKMTFPRITFESAVFKKNAIFTNRIFTNQTVFKDTEFYVAPNFHNAELHQDTDFEGAKFYDTSEFAERAYRTLKLAMEKHRARREEAKFYALEQKSLRSNKNIGKWVKFFSWLYEKSSNYGQSIGRPLACLAGVILLFTLIYAFIASLAISIESNIDLVLLWKSFVFSLQQTVSPFRIWGANNIPIWLAEYKSWIPVVGLAESILTIPFIALFILSIRWRFKRG